jgi:stage II sporulation protein D
MKKNHIILILLLILFGIFSIIGFAAHDSLEIIKIGLQYPKSEEQGRLALVNISTDSHFEFGEIIEQKYIKHLELNGLDSFSFDFNEDFYAVIGPLETYDASKQLSETLADDSFVVKGEGYYVYSKGYKSSQEAIEKVSQWQGHNASLVEPNKRLILIKKSKNVFGYIDSTGDYLFSPVNSQLENAIFKFGNVNYRGGIGAKNQYFNDLSIINYIYMHEYLYGVVPREMSKTWPIEALKAQAVVARNYALVNQNKFMDYGFNLDNTVNSQVYGGFDWEGPISNAAVDATRNIALYHEGSLVNGFYHSNSGGYTENSENVWSQPIAYLKGVYDPFSTPDEFSLTYTNEMIEKRLKDHNYDIGKLLSFEISDYTPNNRVYNARFIGSISTIDLPKQTIRGVFGYNEIRSTLLKIEPDNGIYVSDGKDFYVKSPSSLHVISGDNTVEMASDAMVVSNGSDNKSFPFLASAYKVTGSGWGHGIGMSQWGAKVMAEQGYTFDQILTFYYQNTYIE